MKKINKVELQKSITAYKNFSEPLCTFMWDSNKNTWIYEHFTQLYLMKPQNGRIWLDYLEDLYFPKDVIDYEFISFDKFGENDDINAFLINRINDEYCLMIFADEFYITNSKYFQIKHSLIQLFIYGYDDENKTLYGVGFNKSGQFGFVTYTFEEVLNAYKSIFINNLKREIWVEWYMCVLMRNDDATKVYQFHLEKLLSDLANYLHSNGNSKQLRPEIVFERGENAVYGMDVYKEIILSLDELKNGLFAIDYRHFHLLEEHKRLLLQKVEYAAGLLKLYDTLQNEISELKRISKVYEKLKILFMKQVMIDTSMGNLYGQLRNTTVIEELKQTIQCEFENEKKVLIRILEVFNQYM